MATQKWHIDRPYGEPGTYISADDTSLVAKVWDNDDTKANAALIAAAPELLDKLEKAVARQGFTNQELIEAREAIAKAKGGQP